MKKEILKTAVTLLGVKFMSSTKKTDINTVKQYLYAMKLFDSKKYFECWCYILANIDEENYVHLDNKKNKIIFDRIKQLKQKTYSNKEIASIVAKEFINEKV